MVEVPSWAENAASWLGSYVPQGSTPSWVPQWLKDFSTANTAQDQYYRQLSQQPTGPHNIPAAVSPEDFNTALALSGAVRPVGKLSAVQLRRGMMPMDPGSILRPQAAEPVTAPEPDVASEFSQRDMMLDQAVQDSLQKLRSGEIGPRQAQATAAPAPRAPRAAASPSYLHYLQQQQRGILPGSPEWQPYQPTSLAEQPSLGQILDALRGNGA
jgi:hypothetical protein